jgi:hypothetical protein
MNGWNVMVQSVVDRSVIIDPENIAHKKLPHSAHFVFQCDINAKTTSLNTFLILRTTVTLNKYALFLVRAIEEIPGLRMVFLLDGKSELDQFFDCLKDAEASVRSKVFDVLFFPDSMKEIERITQAWSDGSQDEFIARARVQNDELIVTSFGMKTFRIKFEALSTLRSIKLKERQNFKILENGRKISWGNDVDVTLEIIRYHTEPRFRIEQDLHALNVYGLCGAAIKHMRGSLSREELHKRGGPSAKQLARVESSTSVPTLNMLHRLAKVYGLNQQQYIHELLRISDQLESEKIEVFKRKRSNN